MESVRAPACSLEMPPCLHEHALALEGQALAIPDRTRAIKAVPECSTFDRAGE